MNFEFRAGLFRSRGVFAAWAQQLLRRTSRTKSAELASAVVQLAPIDDSAEAGWECQVALATYSGMVARARRVHRSAYHAARAAIRAVLSRLSRADGEAREVRPVRSLTARPSVPVDRFLVGLPRRRRASRGMARLSA